MPFQVVEGKSKRFKKTIAFRKIEPLEILAKNLRYEMGGSLDFDAKGRFVRYQLFPPGKRDEIDLYDDLVIEFHFHPDLKHVAFPSLTDLMAQAKRSINANTPRKKINKFKKFRGPLAIVFSRYGAVTYSYNKCRLPSKSDQDKILALIMRVANASKVDTDRTMQLMAEFVRTFGFSICFFPWPQIKREGLKLRWTARRFHKKLS